VSDIASLGFDIDSKPLAEANKEVAKMPVEAAKAERSVKSLSDSVNKLGTTSSAAAAAAARVANDNGTVAKALGATDAAYKAATANAQNLAKAYQTLSASATKAANDNANAARRVSQYSRGGTGTGGWGAVPTVLPPAAGGGSGAGSIGGAGAGGGPRLASAAATAATAVDTVTTSVARAVIGIAALAGAMGFAVMGYVRLLAAVNALQDAEELELRRLTTLTGSRELATALYRDIAKAASEAGIGMEVLTERFAQFSRAGAGLGATQKAFIELAMTTEKLTLLSGASKGEGDAARGALAKMLKDSTVGAEDLRTVLSSVPQIADRIALGLGISAAQLKLMATDGQLTNKMVFEALLKQTDSVNAEFAKMPRSIGDTFSTMADDLAQVVKRFANLVPLVREYRLAIEAAAAAAKLLNKGTQPETPEQVISRTAGPVFGGLHPSILNSPGGQKGLREAKQDFAAAIATLMARYEEERGAEGAAQSKIVTDNITNALALANKLDPVGNKFIELHKQIDQAEKAIVDLLSGNALGVANDQIPGLVARITDGIRKLRAEADNAGTAFDQALRKLQSEQSQRERLLTPAQRGLEDRIKAISSQGDVSPDRAAMLGNAEHVQSVTRLVEALEAEAVAEEKKTAAMRGGKQAMIDAAVAAAFLAWQMKNVAATTEEAEVAMDVLSERVYAAFAKIEKNKGIQGALGGGRGLQDELNGIAAALKVVEQGAVAMRRAEAAAKSNKGGLELKVFDARQALTDAVTIANLNSQIDLTNKLAAAAGNLALQKQIQLDYDIKLAQQQAGPAAAAAIAEGMRSKAAADSARAYADIIAQSQEYVASQDIERQALFLSAEAATRLRFEYELLNKLKQAGVELTPAVVAGAQQSAAAMASAQARTNELRQAIDFAKSTTTSFLTEARNNLMQGQNAWDAFGNAGLNALTKISDKLLEMAANQASSFLFDLLGSAIGGALGGGISPIGGGFDIGAASAMPGGFMPGFAKGAAFRAGNVIPFARGTVVNRPTLFPMANGTGLMGEAGPEGILPLRRGPDGRLGVANFGGGQSQSGRVDIYIHDGTEMLNVTIDNRADARIVRASPEIVKRSTDQSRKQVMSTVDQHQREREGDWRVA